MSEKIVHLNKEVIKGRAKNWFEMAWKNPSTMSTMSSVRATAVVTTIATLSPLLEILLRKTGSTLVVLSRIPNFTY